MVVSQSRSAARSEVNNRLLDYAPQIHAAMRHYAVLTLTRISPEDSVVCHRDADDRRRIPGDVASTDLDPYTFLEDNDRHSAVRPPPEGQNRAIKPSQWPSWGRQRGSNSSTKGKHGIEFASK
jgi:hypothetical protein